MTVGEMLGRMTSYELSEWEEFYKLEPFGEERADIRSGIIACVIANVNRGKNQPAYKVEDFMPKFKKKEPQTVDQMKNLLKGFCGDMKKVNMQ